MVGNLEGQIVQIGRGHRACQESLERLGREAFRKNQRYVTLWRLDGTSQQINSRDGLIVPSRVLGCLHCPLPLRPGSSGWKPRGQARPQQQVACMDHHVSAISAVIGSMATPNHRGPFLSVDAQLSRRDGSTGLVRLADRSGISAIKTVISSVNQEEHKTAAQ